MIAAIVARVLKAPVFVLAAVVALVAAGLWSFKQLNIEAYPNPIAPMIEVIAQPSGLSSEEVERYVTVPLEVALAGMRGLEHMRSQSLFGLSDVKCYFNWDTPYDVAKQDVVNRLQFTTLPPNVQAKISPWNAVGEIARYTVEGAGYSLMDRKTAQDFILERQLRRVPGVIDVTGFGGETKQFHIEVDPFRLRGHSVTLPQVLAAAENANQNVGGERLTLGDESYNVRGIGLIENLHDIEDTVVDAKNGVPVRVADVANVEIGPAPRLGQVGQDERPDVVQGIVLMRYGAETGRTLDGLRDRLERIRANHLLPPGMYVKLYYERGTLVKLTTHTVLENLVFGMVLVTVVLLLFLGSIRGALIAALNIPLALLFAFTGLLVTGTSANLISIGAVDFGIVADSTVIMVESLFRQLGVQKKGTIQDRILAGAREVAMPMAFSTLIICVAFLPLFTLTGVSGVIFAPMARTYAFAIGGAILLALTLTPVVASKVIPADTEEHDSWLMGILRRLYHPLLAGALRHPKRVLLFGAIPVLACVALFPVIGREFMPKLEEGNIWIRATLPMSISREVSARYSQRMAVILNKHPEILTVTYQAGRPDDGTDVAGFNNVELFAPLVPLDRLPHHETKQQLIAQLDRELKAEFPGTTFGFSQMISDNVEEALSGVKGENAVKVFGPDLETNERIADQIVDIMAPIRGVQDLGIFRSLGQPHLKITPDRKACARYQLNTGDVGNIVAAAIGGTVATTVYQGEKTFDLTVRYLPPYRASVSAIGEIPVSTPDHVSVPLAQLASIEAVNGPAYVYREEGMRYVPVKFSVRGRDLAGTVQEAQRQIAKRLKLPFDVHLEWTGEVNELNDAESRLIIIVPLTLLLIGFLVYAAVRSWIATLIVLVGIPVACTGGLLALLITGTSFSVSAAMGFVSVFGIAVQDALLVVTYFQRLYQIDGLSLEESAREASEKRFRPALMTTLVAALGLLPAALSNGLGAQAQKPLAIVVIGGALELAILTRVLQPALLVVAYGWLERRKRAKEQL